jgi:ferrochelatase
MDDDRALETHRGAAIRRLADLRRLDDRDVSPTSVPDDGAATPGDVSDVAETPTSPTVAPSQPHHDLDAHTVVDETADVLPSPSTEAAEANRETAGTHAQTVAGAPEDDDDLFDPEPPPSTLDRPPPRLAPVVRETPRPQDERATAEDKADPFAVMTSAVAPRPKGERRGWFGLRKAAERVERIEPKASSPEMVDLEPVRAALQSAALRRTDEVPPTGFETDRSDGASGEMSTIHPADAVQIGVLLVNLGTPEAPRAKAVRRYLREFLSDRRVIEKDTFAWQLALRSFVLPLRSRRTARAYRAIWNKEKNESPLKTITRLQAEKLQEALAPGDSSAIVDWAMRYGNPSIETRMKALIAQGCERIVLVPLYPQYSSSTTASVCDEAFRVLTRLRNQPALRVAPPYYANPIYIEAIASSIRDELARLPFEPEVIVASYHGMPKESVEKSDPYYDQCARTTELLRERLGISEAAFVMTFQSRFGRAEWLQPYTDETLRKLAKDGVRGVAVVTPGFAADCLETLEEIAIEGAHAFRRKGGKHFAFVPCLNYSERGLAVIREIAGRELMGWA